MSKSESLACLLELLEGVWKNFYNILNVDLVEVVWEALRVPPPPGNPAVYPAGTPQAG